MSYKLNKFLLFIILLTATGLTSCKKYLDSVSDLPNTSYFDLATAFSSVSNATSVLNGAYGALQGDQAYGIRLSMYYTVDCDELRVGGNLDNGRRGVGMYCTTAANTELAGPYNRLYLAVERANLCIEQIPMMAKYNGVDSVALHALHGQALAIRALAYLDLIRNFGDVPSIFVPSYRLPYNYSFVKADRDSIYNRIILKDLPLAETLLQWSTGITATYFNKGSVKALRAKIALFRGGYSLRRASSIYGQTMARTTDYLTFYQIAKDECSDIINSGHYHLNPKYEDIFHKYICGLQDDPTGEMIFQVAMSDGQTNGGETSSKLGYYNGPKMAAGTSFGSSGGGLLALPTYFYSFDSTDPRRDVSITVYTRTALNPLLPDLKTVQKLTSITDGKFRRDWRNPLLGGTTNYLGYDWPVIRYADILLMYAEADNELGSGGPSSLAINAYEAVRTRALGNNIGTTPTSHDDFFTALINERSLEFGGEGIRKFDLIRWNLLNTKINQAKTDMASMFNTGGPSGKYAGYPVSMYYTNNGNEIVWGNSFYNSPGFTPLGSKVDWCKSGTTATTYISTFAQCFTPNHSELLPIAQSIIDASNGSLVNDYGY